MSCVQLWAVASSSSAPVVARASVVGGDVVRRAGHEIAVGWYNDGESQAARAAAAQSAAGEGDWAAGAGGGGDSLRAGAVPAGHDAQRRGDHRGAYDAYKLSIAADPNNADCLNNMGKALSTWSRSACGWSRTRARAA